MKMKAIDYNEYDHIIIAFSGGKDSTACVLHALESGADKNKIELWHHDVDGRESGGLMDWPITPGYCKAFAQALGLPLYFSWKQGGFEREMNRENSRTAPTMFETPEGLMSAGGTAGKLSTRKKFPQVTANLLTRWCSAYLKIDICTMAIRNQARFNGKKVLVVTGERAEESSSRANYKTFEIHKADKRAGKVSRHVDQYRPVHSWSEALVWEIIKRWGIQAHPAYYLGWGRVSCMACIFGSANQWATVKAIAPDTFKRISSYEKEFKTTIHRSKSIEDLAASGSPYSSLTPEVQAQAMSREYTADIIIKNWTLPAGAFGESCGPA
jgi:3'-phosphoadenosine 5'-phosphosulfate sulfotransferase (PAPS reductase)/FAD synthetase